MALTRKQAETRALKRLEKIATRTGLFIESMLRMNDMPELEKRGYARGAIDTVARIEGESAIELAEMIANDDSYRFPIAQVLARGILAADRI